MKKPIDLLLKLLLLTGCRERGYQPTQTDPLAPEPADDELVPVGDYIPGIREELAYATRNNFTGHIIYEFTESYLRYGTVKKLKQVNDELAAQGLGLVIWDAFRPVAAQQKLWDICPDPVYVSNPVTGNRPHCRGNAVDVTLAELQSGQLLEMPTEFDDFSGRAARDYAACGEEAARNARLLEEAMVRYGFRPYSAEWWHFSDAQNYPVEETFNPSGVG